MKVSNRSIKPVMLSSKIVKQTQGGSLEKIGVLTNQGKYLQLYRGSCWGTRVKRMETQLTGNRW